MISKKFIIDAFQKLNNNGSILRTIVYTIGHMCIAICCLMAIAKVPFMIALIFLATGNKGVGEKIAPIGHINIHPKIFSVSFTYVHHATNVDFFYDEW